MQQKTIQAIILAAGKSTRFNTGRSKLVEKICGQEMILYTTSLLQNLAIPAHLVVGYQAPAIQEVVTRHHNNYFGFLEQTEQKGTGHAVLCTRSVWHADTLLIINGDVPLITSSLITTLLQDHDAHNAAISFVIAHNEDPTLIGYGRIVEQDGIISIVEPTEFKGDTHQHSWINAGIYLINRSFLQEYCQQLQANPTNGEFYLTDLIHMASKNNLGVCMVKSSFDTIRGVNTLKELWAVEQIKRADIISLWMERGVRFMAAQTNNIDINVSIGAGTMISNGVHIVNNSTIGAHCILEPFSIINNAHLDQQVTVRSHCVIQDSHIARESCVGPFAHIQSTTIEQECVIGNFVETKRTAIGNNSKAKHLTLLSDARIGTHTNIGAGTITCNFNGSAKFQTTIGNHAFIGSNNTLIAPITIHDNSYTAAGSTITQDVPEQSLAIARSRQINKLNYVPLLKSKKSSAAPFIAAVKTNTEKTPKE